MGLPILRTEVRCERCERCERWMIFSHFVVGVDGLIRKKGCTRARSRPVPQH